MLAPTCLRVQAWDIAQLRLPPALSECELQRWFMPQEDFDVRSSSGPKTETEGFSLLVSDLASQNSPLISACHLELYLVELRQIYVQYTLCTLRFSVEWRGVGVQFQIWRQVERRRMKNRKCEFVNGTWHQTDYWTGLQTSRAVKLLQLDNIPKRRNLTLERLKK